MRLKEQRFNKIKAETLSSKNTQEMLVKHFHLSYSTLAKIKKAKDFQEYKAMGKSIDLESFQEKSLKDCKAKCGARIDFDKEDFDNFQGVTYKNLRIMQKQIDLLYEKNKQLNKRVDYIIWYLTAGAILGLVVLLLVSFR